MAVKWTEEQKQVIDLRDRNILVSAAAGSGKTAVLVERIIARLTKDTYPVDVERMLIVTYTEAAAAEMKERIVDALEKALAKNPSDIHLKRQLALIHTAKITTIHSFCLSVIREYFHTIDLDPGFRIAEEGEIRLLKQDVMREMLEARYEQGSEEFLRFVETFATGRGDDQLSELIQELFEYAGSYPDADAWLDGCADAYDTGLSEGSPFVQALLSYMKECLQDIQKLFAEAEEICREADGPYMYEKTIEADWQRLEPVFNARDLEGYFLAFQSLGAWAKLAANRDKEVSREKAERVKALRGAWKKLADDIQCGFFFQPRGEMEEDIALSRPVIHTLVELVKEFDRAFAAKKAEKNVIDFRDMEHFALKILTRREEGKLVPSEAAKEYQEQFVEVMIDEYQDSNLIQEAILGSVSRSSKGENNLFMVGDVKQSIYRFRLSRPELFMEKFDSYSTEEGDCRRIDLHKNFRSRREVLDSVNVIFRQIMTRKLGKIEYDDNAALYVGATYKEQKGNETEILVIDTETLGEEEESPEDGGYEGGTGGKGRSAGADAARETEARAAAERIHALLESHRVWDKELNEFRPVQCRDIALLTRSLAGWTDIFIRVLGEEGIPAFAPSKEGYFGTPEIGWMLDYLRVLDNFRQDIPLAAVLKSPFGECTNEELACIRKRYPKVAFHEAALMTAGILDEPEQTDADADTDAKRNAGEGKREETEEIPQAMREKLARIFGELARFRERVPYTAIHDLLWMIMKETGYRDYVYAMPGGEQRLANLEMLLARAKSFEAASYKGLFHFVRYIGQLQKYNVDFGEAGIYDEGTDAVRVMSIHKSKGLEFPVVIVAGMGKQFNTQDLKGSIVVHPELGVGMDAVDLVRRTKCPTIFKKIIQTETKLENLGEELRVLYVAMTRAKEKLILLGTVSKAAKKLADYEAREEDARTPLSFTTLAGAKCYYDWVLPAAAKLSGTLPLTVTLLDPGGIRAGGRTRRKMDRVEKEMFLNAAADRTHPLAKTDERFAKRLMEQFTYRYPFEKEEQFKLKYTVSELKKRSMPLLLREPGEDGEILVEEEEVIPLVPKFMQEEHELTGASRGSAYHKLLELLDFTKEYTKDTLAAAVAHFQEEKLLSEEMAVCIRAEDIQHFLSTDIGKRMHQAALLGRLYREQPFVFGIDAGEMYPGADNGELVLIQGIIDVFFEEEDRLIVLDYKTDKAREAGELVEKYQEQLHLYGRALEQMTGKKAAEKVIYSFTLRQEIVLE